MRTSPGVEQIPQLLSGRLMTQLNMDLGPDTTLELAQWHCRWASEHLIIDPDSEPEPEQDDRTCVPKYWAEEVER